MKLVVAQQFKKFTAFMEPEGLLPFLQVPANKPYPAPDKSSSHPPIIFL
jgi:hypothetical protein